jgi:hypothetical protein
MSDTHQSASCLQAHMRRSLKCIGYKAEQREKRIERSCRSLYKLSREDGGWSFKWLDKLKCDLLERYLCLDAMDIDKRIAEYIGDEMHKDWLTEHARPQNKEDNNTVLQGLRKLILQKGMPPCGPGWGNFDKDESFTKQWYDNHGPPLSGDIPPFTDTARAYCQSGQYHLMPYSWTQEGIDRRLNKWVTSWPE